MREGTHASKGEGERTSGATACGASGRDVKGLERAEGQGGTRDAPAQQYLTPSAALVSLIFSAIVIVMVAFCTQSSLLSACVQKMEFLSTLRAGGRRAGVAHGERRSGNVSGGEVR